MSNYYEIEITPKTFSRTGPEEFAELVAGADFVDAVAGVKKSQGHCTINGLPFTWQSTFDICNSEKYIRKYAEKEKARVTLFISQSL